jgi:hypothetical protein
MQVPHPTSIEEYDKLTTFLNLYKAICRARKFGYEPLFGTFFVQNRYGIWVLHARCCESESLRIYKASKLLRKRSTEKCAYVIDNLCYDIFI